MSAPGVYLMLEMLEYLANNGELDPFHALINPETGYDGLEEIIQDFIDRPSLLDDREDWC